MILHSGYPEFEVPETGLPALVLGDLGAHRGRTALVDAATGRALTFGDVAHQVDRIAAALAERGIGPGDVVAVFAPNSPEYPVVFYGALAAGAAVSTINVLYTSDEIAHQLRDSAARALFTWTDGLPRARQATAAPGVHITEIVLIDGEPRAGGGVPASTGTGAGPAITETTLQDYLRTSGPAPAVTISGDDLAALPYSSGTTGRPKGVMLTHRNLVANMIQSQLLGRVCDTTVALAVLPLFHIYGMTAIMNLALYRRAKVVTMPRFDLEAFLAAIQEHRVDHLYLAPPLALALAKHPLVDSYDLSSVEMVLSAAAPLSADLAEAVQRRLGCTVLQGYGLTESSPATHGIPHDRPDIDRGSVGVLLPNVEARVVDPATGADSGTGASGELWCRGPNIMRGYLNNPQATAEAVDNEGFLHTGDLVTVTEDGVFHVVDRLKELIKYNGYQVPPAELEAVLLAHPAIADAAVIGVDDENGQLPKAFVVREPGSAHAELDGKTVMDFVAERVAPHKKVRAVEFVEAIPKSSAGKVLRRELRAREARPNLPVQK